MLSREFSKFLQSVIFFFFAELLFDEVFFKDFVYLLRKLIFKNRFPVL